MFGLEESAIGAPPPMAAVDPRILAKEKIRKAEIEAAEAKQKLDEVKQSLKTLKQEKEAAEEEAMSLRERLGKEAKVMADLERLEAARKLLEEQLDAQAKSREELQQKFENEKAELRKQLSQEEQEKEATVSLLDEIEQKLQKETREKALMQMKLDAQHEDKNHIEQLQKDIDAHSNASAAAHASAATHSSDAPTTPSAATATTTTTTGGESHTEWELKALKELDKLKLQEAQQRQLLAKSRKMSRFRVREVEELMEDKITLISPHRYHVKDGPLRKLTAGNALSRLMPYTPFWYILFNDIMIYTSMPNSKGKVKLKQILPLIDMVVQDVPQSTPVNGVKVKHALQITSSIESCHVVARNSAEKCGWLAVLRDTIHELQTFQTTHQSFRTTRATLSLDPDGSPSSNALHAPVIPSPLLPPLPPRSHVYSVASSAPAVSSASSSSTSSTASSPTTSSAASAS